MQTVKLGTLGTFQSGGTPKKSEPRFFGGKIPWISTTALDGAPIGAEAAATFLTDDALRHSAAKWTRNSQSCQRRGSWKCSATRW